MNSKQPRDSIAAQAAINLQSISLSIDVASGQTVHILNDVNLRIPAQAQCGLAGPSGSGKTSLLTIIAGLRRPSSGAATILGHDFTACDEERLAGIRRDNIGIVFQNFHLLPSMTALENVSLPLELAEAENAQQQAETMLEAVGLGHRLEHFPHQLSGGEQQRTAIARAFAAKPRLVLADEPTGNLDSATSAMVMETLHRMRAETDSCMLLITHDAKLLEQADMVVHMRNGTLNHA